MARDLLHEVYTDQITEDAAEDFFDEVVDRIHEGEDLPTEPMRHAAALELGLDRFEERALWAGVPFKILAGWRYAGWPNQCEICGRPVVNSTNATESDWHVVSLADRWSLVHSGSCFQEYLASLPAPEPEQPFDPTRDGEPGTLRLTPENTLEFALESGIVQDISFSAWLHLCDESGNWHHSSVQRWDDGLFRCYEETTDTWHPIEWALNMPQARLSTFVRQKKVDSPGSTP